jgi:hypothetical protein
MSLLTAAGELLAIGVFGLGLPARRSVREAPPADGSVADYCAG